MDSILRPNQLNFVSLEPTNTENCTELQLSADCGSELQTPDKQRLQGRGKGKAHEGSHNVISGSTTVPTVNHVTLGPLVSISVYVMSRYFFHME